MPGNNAPQIAASAVHVAGEDVQVIGDAVPEHFPHGLEVLIVKPGALAPLGRALVPAGHMLAVLPLGMSTALRAEIRKILAAQNSKQGTKPPGLKG